MSEDKMREEFEECIRSSNYMVEDVYGVRRYSDGMDYIDVDVQKLWIGWKACAAIKDAEIAKLHTLVNAQTVCLQESNKEIVARDLMIKELREAFTEIASYKDKPLTGIIAIALRAIAKHALAKSEHHNSRALEKMLLEASINELNFTRNAILSAIARRDEMLVEKLAELNKE